MRQPLFKIVHIYLRFFVFKKIISEAAFAASFFSLFAEKAMISFNVYIIPHS